MALQCWPGPGPGLGVVGDAARRAGPPGRRVHPDTRPDSDRGATASQGLRGRENLGAAGDRASDKERKRLGEREVRVCVSVPDGVCVCARAGPGGALRAACV